MRKIGELKGKPIVEGNPNEIKNNQIHYKELDSKITLSERQNTELVNITGGSGNISNQDTSNARIIKEYYYFDYVKMLIDKYENEAVNEFINLISYIFENEPNSLFTKIIYKVSVNDENYVYTDTNTGLGSGNYSEDIKIAIAKYEPLAFNGSGADLSERYIDIKKIFTEILSGYDKSIDDIFNEYGISEEEFWKDAIIVD